MKAGVIFTGTGPILILTTYDGFDDKNFIEKLAVKGIKKFIAYEIPVDLVKKKYARYFDIVIQDVKQTDDLRVLDYNGHSVFHTFSFAELQSPFLYDGD